MTEKKIRILNKNFRISMRLHHVILPFSQTELISVLATANLGYALAPPPRGLSTGTAEPAREIAMKGNTMVDIDLGKQIVGTSGTNSYEVGNVFAEIYDVIEATLVPDLKEKVTFFEVLSNYSIAVEENTLATFEKHKYENNIEQEISDILDEKLGNYSIHLCSNEKLVDSDDWFDIHILPSGRRSSRELDIFIVCRKPDKKKVEKVLENMDNNLSKIVKTL